MVKLSTPRPVKAVMTTPSRAANTTYQNTTGRPIVIIVTVTCYRAGLAGATAYAYGLRGTSSPPITIGNNVGFLDVDTLVCYGMFTLVQFVPNNYYYQVATVASGTGSYVNLSNWTEIEL